MIQEQPSKIWIPITVAIIGGCFAVIAAIVSGFAERIADRILPPITPTLKSINTQNHPQITTLNEDLIINGVRYSYPNSDTEPFCIAQEIHTNGKNRVKYEITVPRGWTMVWDSNKAYWPNGQYENNGLLIIVGEWNGEIEIDTGGSCSGPVEWLDFIIRNRKADYPIASRPEFYLGEVP